MNKKERVHKISDFAREIWDSSIVLNGNANADQPRYVEVNKIFEIVEKHNATLQSQLDIANKKLKDLEEYINYLVILNPNIGRFNKTTWGQEMLEIIGGE